MMTLNLIDKIIMKTNWKNISSNRKIQYFESIKKILNNYEKKIISDDEFHKLTGIYARITAERLAFERAQSQN